MTGKGLDRRIWKRLSSSTFISSVWASSLWPNPLRLPQRWIEGTQSFARTGSPS